MTQWKRLAQLFSLASTAATRNFSPRRRRLGAFFCVRINLNVSVECGRRSESKGDAARSPANAESTASASGVRALNE